MYIYLLYFMISYVFYLTYNNLFDHLHFFNAFILLIIYKSVWSLYFQILFTGRNFANNYGFQFFETSAVSGKNVEEVFVSLASQIYSKVISGEYSLSSGWEGVREGAALLLSEPSSLTNSTIITSDCGVGKCC